MRNSKGLFSTLAYFTMFIFGLQVCGQQFILLDIAEEYGMNNTAMGALSSIGFIAGLCSTILLGGLIDKKNQRLLSAVCTAAMAVGGLLVLFVPNFIGLVLGLTLIGFAGSLLPAAVPVMLSKYDPAHSSRYASITEVAYSSGSVLGPLLMAALMGQGISWRALYVIVAALSAVVAAALFWMHSPKAEMGEVVFAQNKGSLGSVLTPVGILIVLTGLTYSSMEAGINSYAKPYFTEAYPNPTAASTTIAIIAVAMVISKLLSGFIHKHKAAVAAACCLGGSMMAFAMVLVPGAWSSYIWCILFGLIAGPAWPLTMSVAIDSFPENPGRIGTLLQVGGSTGGATVGVFMGMLADSAGLRICFLYPAAAGLLASAAMLSVRVLNRKKKKEQAA